MLWSWQYGDIKRVQRRFQEGIGRATKAIVTPGEMDFLFSSSWTTKQRSRKCPTRYAVLFPACGAKNRHGIIDDNLKELCKLKPEGFVQCREAALRRDKMANGPNLPHGCNDARSFDLSKKLSAIGSH